MCERACGSSQQLKAQTPPGFCTSIYVFDIPTASNDAFIYYALALAPAAIIFFVFFSLFFCEVCGLCSVPYNLQVFFSLYLDRLTDFLVENMSRE